MVKRTTHICLALILSLTIFIQAKAQILATWDLTNTSGGTPSNVIADIMASDFTRGNGISTLQYSSDGVNARLWPQVSELGEVDYYEVCITPNPGNTIFINALQFSEKRSDDGIRAYEIYWSVDDFETEYRIDSTGVGDNTQSRLRVISSLDIEVCNGQPICFRWYAYGSESENGFWWIEDNSLQITGTTSASCTAPTSAGTVGVSNVTGNSAQIDIINGNGDSRVVVLRQGAEVNYPPCNGISYTSNTHFALGELLGNDNYVVYAGNGVLGQNTTVNLTGLVEGATYHVAVFEAFNSGLCYLQSTPAEANFTTDCILPGKLSGLLSSAGNEEISFDWSEPLCQDQVLVIASTSPITGAPSGDGSNYTANLVFGQGSDAGSDFDDDEYPVYFGTDSNINVTGLNNSTTYYFSFFVRNASNWTSALEVSGTPVEGCDELGGDDQLFINEIHYNNAGIDIDEGVEVAGPAGLDLAPYEIHIYEGISPFDAAFLKKVDLEGSIEDEGTGFGAEWVPIPDMPDQIGGIVIYNKVKQVVVQFLNYRASLEAVDGVAQGMTGSRIRRANGSDAYQSVFFSPGTSLQLQGTGSCPDDLDWEMQVPQTIGGLNISQSLLPIELSRFDARLIEGKVLLFWETIAEINNDYMAVEKSLDGKKFTEIGRVAGAGTTTIPQQYQLWDEEPNKGINYYRLRQADFDGATEYSDVIAVQIATLKDGNDFNVFPTIAQHVVNIQFEQAISEKTTIQLINTKGQVLNDNLLPMGLLTHQINVESLNPGVYILHVYDQRKVFSKRFIKQ